MRPLVLALALLAFPTSAHAGSCFFQSERKSGMNKICFYRCLSGTKAITVGALDFCPMTIDE
jgi:hypothetical protein